MSGIFLGNIQFDQIEEKLGYKLTEAYKELWNKFHNYEADLSGKKSSFHVFDIPRSIQFKGEDAKNAILQMFTPDKIVKSIGRIQIYRVKEEEQK